MNPAPEFSHEIELDAVPKAGRRFALEAGAPERAAIAKRLGVIAVDQLSGVVEIRASKDRFSVTGSVSARLTRECVATLAEMTEDVNEPFEIDFLRSAETPEAEEEELTADAPEYFEGSTFDVGELLVQQLSLAMAAFPRISGARSLATEFGAEEEASPFGQALTQALKTKKNQ